MKCIAKSLTVLVLLSTLLLCVVSVSQAYVPPGWQKITGRPFDYSGFPDGIGCDRQNSYAWAMEFHGGYLYVGSNRNVIAGVLDMSSIPPGKFPPELPIPTDFRARIYRMKLSTGRWECAYISPAVYVKPTGEASSLPPQQPAMGVDVGYRMMKTFRSRVSPPVLYIGGSGDGYCRMLAVDSCLGCPKEVFHVSSPGFISIRAITEYNNQLFWASEVRGYPTIWCSNDPLYEVKKNPRCRFDKVEVPCYWFPDGAEIFDMISFNGWMYVFFVPHGEGDHAFWCAKFRKTGSTWEWDLIVGPKCFGGKYPPGMGRPYNAGTTPFIFKNRVWVGTLNAVAFKVISGAPIDPEEIKDDFVGSQIWAFDREDCWERILPPSIITDPKLETMINGFINPLNLYVWRFGAQGDRLYAGTFDSRTLVEMVAPWFNYELPKDLWDPCGFDIYSTTDGIFWWPETVDGFGDKWNYGARTFITNPLTNDLYLGTANPFYGCQVWKKCSGVPR